MSCFYYGTVRIDPCMWCILGDGGGGGGGGGGAIIYTGPTISHEIATPPLISSLD